MELSPMHLELMPAARILGTDRGMLLEPWAEPIAEELEAERWLRATTLANGDRAWFLTRIGECSLDQEALIQTTEGREN